MKTGRIIRLPSEKETQRAKDNNQQAYFPSVGRYFTSKKGQIMVTLSWLPDVVLMLQEDKPRDNQPDKDEDVFE